MSVIALGSGCRAVRRCDPGVRGSRLVPGAGAVFISLQNVLLLIVYRNTLKSLDWQDTSKTAKDTVCLETILWCDREKEAVALLTQVAGSDYWPSFAACAAEADLLRLRGSAKL